VPPSATNPDATRAQHKATETLRAPDGEPLDGYIWNSNVAAETIALVDALEVAARV